jgi:plastocyanin
MDGQSHVPAAIAMIFIPVAVLISGPREDVSGQVQLSNGRKAASAVVIFEGSAKAEPLAKAVVDQRDRKFIPHVSVVTVGTRVDFPNNDTVFHNVFTEFHSTRFDLGMYARGEKRSKTFNQTGLAVLMCSIHPDMLAYVMVVDTPYYAITDSSGHFRLGNVPAGHYRLQVWHESGQKDEEDITIGSDAPMSIRLKP